MPLIFLQNKNFIIHSTKQQNIQIYNIKVFLLFLTNPRDAFYWWELSFWSSRWRHGFSGLEHITWYISEHPFCSEYFPKAKFQLILKRWMWYSQKSFINALNDIASFTQMPSFARHPPSIMLLIRWQTHRLGLITLQLPLNLSHGQAAKDLSGHYVFLLHSASF